MAIEHTPGPWILIDPGMIGYAKDKAVVKGEGDFDWVATVQVSNVPGWRANARLIAAAPDLLAASTFALDFLNRRYQGDCTDDGRECQHEGCEAIRALRAATAKVCGNG